MLQPVIHEEEAADENISIGGGSIGSGFSRLTNFSNLSGLSNFSALSGAPSIPIQVS